MIRHRLGTALLTLTLTLAAAHAQTAASPNLSSTAVPIAPPMLPLLVNYQYWPTQYLQFVTGPELPLSMFELDVDSTGKQPVYHAVLTGKDGKRTHYSNVDGVVAAYKAQGEPAFKTAIEFEGDDSQKVGAASTVRFTLEDGRPLEFRFVLGSEVGEQGAGVQPLPGVPLPIFAYREAGAVAGEGTALKIGDTVSTAEVWTEISKPPYFVGYRGASTQSAHTLVLAKGSEHWTVSKAPAALTVGEIWELTGDRGKRSLQIDKVDGMHVTVTETDSVRPGVRFTIDAARTTDGWQVERVRFAPAKDGDKHSLTLLFPSPAVLEITAGRKTKIASAALTSAGTAADRTMALKITAPAWAAGKSLSEEAITGADGSITVTAQ